MRDLKRRIYLLGVGSPILFFLIATAAASLIVFRFDAQMMLKWLFITLIAIGIVVPPAVIYLVSRTNRIFKAASPGAGGGAREDAPGAAAALKAIDSYPTAMALTVLAAGSAAAVIESVLLHLMADYNAFLCLVYGVITFGIALFAAYLQAYILYSTVEPLRRTAYSLHWQRGYSGGLRLKSRIVILGMVMCVVILIIGWTVAATGYIFGGQSSEMERQEESTTLMAGETAALESWRSEKAYEDTAVSFGSADDGMVILVDERGRVVDRVVLGEGVEEEESDELLVELLESGEKSTLNKSMTMVAAIAPISDTGYSLVQISPLESMLSEVASLTFFYLIIVLIALPFAYYLGKITSDSISVPIRDMRATAASVAEGDLTVHLDMSSSDDVGQLTAAFSDMLRSLHALSARTLSAADETSGGASGVAATSQQIQSSLDQLSGIIQQMAESANREARMAEEVYSLSTEIHGALELSASQADEGAEASMTSSSLAEEGRNDAAVAIEKMTRVRESIGDAVETIKTLGEQSEEIGIVGEVIDNIADQTNLLALNAAIEAARAQEQGRGFSVVAEEVRKLAVESTASTARIATLVRGIQANTRSAVEQAERASKEVSEGMQVVQVTGNSLERINEYVSRSAELSSAIAETTKRQLMLGERIMKAMEEIRNIAEQNASNSEELSASSQEQAAAMEELTATSQQLTGLADNMKGLVERYKL
ncbi:MAG: HAMP domain-containing methyl-accepting chemotaxis protein [Actinomycetota bacterium]